MLIEIKETNVNKEIVIPNLHEKIKNDEVDDCMQKLYQIFQKILNQNSLMEEHINKFLKCLRNLLENFILICISFYKTFPKD